MYWISNGWFPRLIKRISSSNVYCDSFPFISGKPLVMIQINKGKHTGIVKWQKCQCTRSMKAASLVFGCIAFLRRLPDCAVLEVYWGIQDAHHNKMLMADTKHCADRISIRGLLTVREREGWMPECSNPTCLSLHLLERGWNQPPGRSISASAWPHLSPLNEKQCLHGKMKRHGSEECGITPDSSGRPHNTSVKHS